MAKIVAEALRCFMKLSPAEEEKKRGKWKKKETNHSNAEAAEPAAKHAAELEAVIREKGGIWPYRTIIMDFETLSGALSGQKIRFGYAQLRGIRYDNDKDPDDNTIVGHAKRGTLSLEIVPATG